MAKEYVRKGFEEKIMMNLARICRSEDDKFGLARVEYTRDFTCELCEHQHLSMCYWVKNLSTNLIIKVGSECIHHFSVPQSDLDKAEALRKRVERSIESGRDIKVREFGTEMFNELPEETRNKRYFLQSEIHDIIGNEAYMGLPESSKKETLVRDEFIMLLGNEKFKSLPRGEKFDLINNFYRLDYAERLLDGVAHGEYLLTKEEIEEIVSLNKEDELAKAEAKAKAKADREVAMKVQRERQKAINELDHEVYVATSNAKNTLTDLDSALAASWHDRAVALGSDYRIDQIIRNTAEFIINERNIKAEYGWLMDYEGDNKFLIDLQYTLRRCRSLTPAQKEAGLKTLDAELHPAPASEEDAGAMLDKLTAKFPGNTFYRGLAAQWRRSHSLSPKQMDCVRKDFANKL